MDDDRTGWSSAANTVFLLVLLFIIFWLGGMVIASMLHGWGIQVRAQTPPYVGYRNPGEFTLPLCDDVVAPHAHACMLVSTEHWGGNLPRPVVVFQCVKTNGRLDNCEAQP